MAYAGNMAFERRAPKNRLPFHAKPVSGGGMGGGGGEGGGEFCIGGRGYNKKKTHSMSCSCVVRSCACMEGATMLTGEVIECNIIAIYFVLDFLPRITQAQGNVSSVNATHPYNIIYACFWTCVPTSRTSRGSEQAALVFSSQS